ncbi:tRNA (N6-isopentenyl adenosine(37)-C2)-methylthiotransferase MiaB [Candidatus Latescibacterota bacterium]
MNVYIETYGCQMNKLDSETAAAILENDGFSVTPDISDADVILLNTCGVRENAEMRIHGRVAELSKLKKERPEIIFGIIGCMAQRLKGDLLSKVVKIVAGPDSYRRLGEMIRRASVEPVVDTELYFEETYGDIKPVRSVPFSAWVAVMRGCNNYCSYCIVPYTRGRERSIPSERIIAEIEDLKQNGCREVTLLGQNVNSYRDGKVDFAALLDRVADTGIGWIRFLTSHPKDLTGDILAVMAGRDNVCPHLHLPLQSGSDPVLKAMNRGYTISEYLALVEKTQKSVDSISLTTDLIFGFPGEAEQDFRATLSVMKSVRYDFAFLYRYSERVGTKACGLPGSVSEQMRIERLKEAIELQREISHEKNRELIGTAHVVLIKALSKDRKGWFGFTDTAVPVVFTAAKNGLDIGSFATVRINSTTGASLIGIAE